MFKHYLEKIGLSALTDDRVPASVVHAAFLKQHADFSAALINRLYFYAVPEATPDGTCSNPNKPAKDPYDLSEICGVPDNFGAVRRHPNTLRLYRLREIVKTLRRLVKPDWLGIYRAVTHPRGERVLVKEAYHGAMSRAEFPLTKAFAQHSNNSTVGLTGKAIVVNDVAQYAGPYYQCDAQVQSEFCCPILDSNGTVIGIIDSESFQKNFFTPDKLLQIAKVCHDLGTINLGV